MGTGFGIKRMKHGFSKCPLASKQKQGNYVIMHNINPVQGLDHL